ncbi:hypothetical protein GTS_51790 [Gandjariella thermophila]|uniref:HTH merR-type domain-containing protein n=1 Tax=Gandjariella thermophila TaxID=1931992 RepID=A0A4D4JGL1_9PSEU|nr:hypothetical protein GTS_51790 [Gandjariella thermophila]
MAERPPTHRAPSAVDDADYPAYTMGRAADMLGVTPDFLRSLHAAGLIRPERSAGGHRRFSRNDLILAARARELLDGGLTLLDAACRITRLERDLHSAAVRIAELEGTAPANSSGDSGENGQQTATTRRQATARRPSRRRSNRTP